MAIDTRFFEQRQGLLFVECLYEAMTTPEFVKEWERLSGKQLIAPSLLDRMVDEATGYGHVVNREFADFVYEAVFSRLPV